MVRKCQKCGGIVGEEDLYCIHCGMPLERVKPEGIQNAGDGGDIQQEKKADEEMARPLRFGEYLLIGVLLLLPVVNIIMAVIWATGRKENPNRRNLARAWLVFAAVGAVMGLLFLIGLFRAIQLDEMTYPEPGYDYYYEEYWDDDDYDWDMEHHWDEIWEHGRET